MNDRKMNGSGFGNFPSNTNTLKLIGNAPIVAYQCCPYYTCSLLRYIQSRIKDKWFFDYKIEDNINSV